MSWLLSIIRTSRTDALEAAVRELARYAFADGSTTLVGSRAFRELVALVPGCASSGPGGGRVCFLGVDYVGTCHLQLGHRGPCEVVPAQRAQRSSDLLADAEANPYACVACAAPRPTYGMCSQCSNAWGIGRREALQAAYAVANRKGASEEVTDAIIEIAHRASPVEPMVVRPNDASPATDSVRVAGSTEPSSEQRAKKDE